MHLGNRIFFFEIKCQKMTMKKSVESWGEKPHRCWHKKRVLMCIEKIGYVLYILIFFFASMQGLS